MMIEVLGWIVPTILGICCTGVIWLFVEAWNRRSDSRDMNTRVTAIERSMEDHNGLPVRITQLETLMPIVMKTMEEIKSVVTEVQRGQQRLEIAIVRNNKAKDPDNDP